ncbi:MAG: hypothetical protein V4523_05015 [Pseudomonadota bacterium]
MRVQLVPNATPDPTLPLYTLDEKLAAVLDLGPSLLLDVKDEYVLGGGFTDPAPAFRAMNLADESDMIAPGGRHPILTGTGASGAGTALGFGWRGDLDFSANNGWLQFADDREHDLSGDFTMAICIFVPTAQQAEGLRGGIVFGERDDANPNYLGTDYGSGALRYALDSTTYVSLPMGPGQVHTAMLSYVATEQVAHVWIDNAYAMSSSGVPAWGTSRLLIGATGAAVANNYYLVADLPAALILPGKAFAPTGIDADRAAVLAWLEQVRVRSVA